MHPARTTCRGPRAAILATTESGLAASVAHLRSAATIRERAGRIFAAGERGALTNFSLDLARLDDVARFVFETTRERYPDLAIPYHSRWRHFEAGGIARWPVLARGLAALPAREIARRRIELVTVSVLLDAGAGESWRYREPGSGRDYARSEGLAVASLALFASGFFSADAKDPMRVDAALLETIDAARLAAGLQITSDNPIVGLEGRAALLRRLGAAATARPDLFGAGARLGHLLDALERQCARGKLPATAILMMLLEAFSEIWPGGQLLDGKNLGDVWPHRAARVDDDDPGDGLVPFHKLSQWLCYSLIEPLEDAGLAVSGIEALTGLPEYRNGGLFIDMGVIVPRRSEILAERHAVSSEIVVEWRALTVVLLDRLAARVGRLLGRDSFPLPLLLEGGSWAAGRRIAAQKRPGGAPPLHVESDGTVF
jgi:hypothetical protein